MVEKAEEMKTILLKLKDEAFEEIGKSVKSGSEKPTDEPSGDIYDQASNERDRELLLLLGDREREKIRNIDEALVRLDDGEYGICEDCEEEIPLGRLKVMPFARLCVKCKADLEKHQAQTKRFEEDRVYREISSTEEEES
jgi:DnaK suppressor protein